MPWPHTSNEIDSNKSKSRLGNGYAVYHCRLQGEHPDSQLDWQLGPVPICPFAMVWCVPDWQLHRACHFCPQLEFVT